MRDRNRIEADQRSASRCPGRRARGRVARSRDTIEMVEKITRLSTAGLNAFAWQEVSPAIEMYAIEAQTWLDR